MNTKLDEWMYFISQIDEEGAREEGIKIGESKAKEEKIKIAKKLFKMGLNKEQIKETTDISDEELSLIINSDK